MDPGSTLFSPGRFSPLRYPGGKGKLARFVAAIIDGNGLSDGVYVEPYAGGAAIACELLLTGRMRRVEINDLSRPIYAFWWAVLNATDDLCARIESASLDVNTWDECKTAFAADSQDDLLQLGFATFFLNRTNRSGILNGGMIGGRNQTGPWKLDARFNKKELVEKISRIGSCRDRIRLTNMDALRFISENSHRWNRSALVYLDPPYFDKGSRLYYDYYRPDDHRAVAAAVFNELGSTNWIVSYDDVDPIGELYSPAPRLRYTIGYSARERSIGQEAMFFSEGLYVPPVMGSMVELERNVADAA